MTRATLPDADTLACAVAAEYAARWARRAARLLSRADALDDLGPWLVDGFAGADLQRAALRGARVAAPAVSFAAAAQAAFGEGARVVLVEEDPGLLARLHDALTDAGFSPRRAGDPADAAPGDVVLVEAPFAALAPRLADAIADGPALVRLAPLSARALPWSALELLADLSGTDLLLRVPGEDFARAGGFPAPLADFPPHLRRVAEGCSALFADERHGWLLAWREAARAGGGDAALAAAVERLRGMLGADGGERTGRAARLEGAGGGAAHVVLSTPHPEHALELNGAVVDGGAPPPESPRKRPRSAPNAAAPEAEAANPPRPPSREEIANSASGSAPSTAAAGADAPAALDLFGTAPAPAPPRLPRGRDLRAVADDLHARHAGERVPFRALLGELADAGLAPEQVRTALAGLKRERRAAYRSLDADGAEVEFLAEAAAPPAPAVARPRKQRQPPPDVLGLFDDFAEPPPPVEVPSTASGDASAEDASATLKSDPPPASSVASTEAAEHGLSSASSVAPEVSGEPDPPSASSGAPTEAVDREPSSASSPPETPVEPHPPSASSIPTEESAAAPVKKARRRKSG